MNPLAHVLTSVGYPHRSRTVPPAEPPDLLRDLPSQFARRFCGRCEVWWCGGPVCWCCGEAGR